jgi:hypothetical protein
VVVCLITGVMAVLLAATAGAIVFMFAEEVVS